MVEKEVRNKEEILEVINQLRESKKITMNEIERQCDIGMGTTSRWKNGASPSLDNILKILKYLDVKMILCTDELEDNSCAKEIELENDSGKKEKDREAYIDDLILMLTNHILRNATLSDKEKLSKILQAFL